jgi:hypothetical protein
MITLITRIRRKRNRIIIMITTHCRVQGVDARGIG